MLGKAVDLNNLTFACLYIKDIQIVQDLKRVSKQDIWLPATRTDDNRKRKKTEPDRKEEEWRVIEKWLVSFNIAPYWCG